MVIVILYGVINLTHGSPRTKHVHLIHPVTWTDAIGFSVYIFEGIGNVIPIKEATAELKIYPKIIALCIFTLMALLLSFALFCVAAWGDELETPLITDNLPGGLLTWCIKIIFGINLLISYQLFLFPAHITIEKHLYKQCAPSLKRKWYKNLNRSILCILISVFTICIN